MQRIIDAVPNMPGSVHRFCAYHIKNNFRKLYGDEDLRKLFWKASRTANFNEFQRIMVQIKALNENAFQLLSAIEPKHWSRRKFDYHPKVEHVTNNLVESFNGWLDKLRSKPPITLLEALRDQHTKLMYTRQATAERYTGRLTPKVENRIQELRKKARRASVRRVGPHEFQVMYEDETCAVKLDDTYCVCEQWPSAWYYLYSRSSFYRHYTCGGC